MALIINVTVATIERFDKTAHTTNSMATGATISNVGA